MDPPRGGKIKSKNKPKKKEEKIGLRGARGQRLGCFAVKCLAQSQAGLGTSTARYSGSSNNLEAWEEVRGVGNTNPAW